MASGIHTFTFTDHTGERSAVRVRGVELTAVNFDAQITASVALQDAIAALTLGIKGKVVYANENIISSAPATDHFAQREIKWLVSYSDDVNGKKYSLEIPTADLDLLPDGAERLDLADTEAAAFVSAFEAFAKSPDGNAVSVIAVDFVARNL